MAIYQGENDKIHLADKLQHISQMTIGLSLSLVVIIIFIGTIIYNIYFLVNNSKSLSIALAHNLAPSLEFNNHRVAKEILTSIKNIPDINIAVVTDRNYNVFSSYLAPGESLPADLQDQLEPITLSLMYIGLTRQINQNEAYLGNLYIQVDLQAYYARMAWLLLVIIITTVISLRLAKTFVSRLNRPVISPLYELADAMERITDNRSYQASTKQYDIVEIQSLANKFYEMLHNLRERDVELETHRQHLESEVKKRTIELSQAKEMAEQASKAKSEFLSSMSHELRTPLNAIIGFSQLMQMEADISQENLDNVSEIIKAGNHLLTLINDILDLSRVESGTLELNIGAVEVEPLIKECVSLVAPIADANRISLQYDIQTDRVISADFTRVKQVLLNLCSNAIKYNQPGGSVELLVSLAGTNCVRFSVTDTGKGIAEDKLSELFTPFNRLGAEFSNIEGTGIGLTITQRLVEMMGGSIGVSSKLSEGSTFWIEFPVHQPGELKLLSDADHGILQVRSESRGERTSQYVVLYIEDNLSNIRLVTQVLKKKENISLLTAHTGEIGLQLAEAMKPDLILLDINLPGMDGYETLQKLKEKVMLKEIPVIAVTAKAMKQDIETGEQAGFSHYITKPLDVTEFLNIIDVYLTNKLAPRCEKSRSQNNHGVNWPG